MNKKLLLIVVANLIVIVALFFMVITGEENDDPLDTDYVLTIIDEKQLQKKQLDAATQELETAKETLERLTEQLDITQLLVDSTEQKYLVCEQQKSEFTGKPPPPRVKPSVEQIERPEPLNCDAELDQLANATAKYQDLEAENFDLKNRLIALQESVEGLEDERKELLSQFDNMRDYENLNDDNAAFQQRISQLQEEIKLLKQENSEAQMENSLTAQKNQDLMLQIEQLRNIENPKFDTSPLETKIDDLEQTVTLLMEREQTALQDIELLTSENTQLQAEVDKLQSKEVPEIDTSLFEQEIARLKQDLESLRLSNEEIQFKNDQTSEKYNNLANENTALSDENKELSSQNTDLLAQIDSLKDAQSNNGESANSELTQRIVQLQQQVDMLRRKNTEIQDESKSEMNKNQVLLAKIKQLENAQPVVSAQPVNPVELKEAKAEIVRLQTLLNSPIALDKHYLGARFCEKPQADSLICVKDFLIRPDFTKAPVSSVAIRVFDEQGFVQAEGRFTSTSNQLYRLSLGAGKELPAGNFKIEYYVDNQVLTGDPITLTQ